MDHSRSKKASEDICIFTVFAWTFVLQKSPTRYSGLFLMHENKGLLCTKNNSRNQEQILSLSHVVIFLHIADTEHVLRTLRVSGVYQTHQGTASWQNQQLGTFWAMLNGLLVDASNMMSFAKDQFFRYFARLF